MFFKQLPARFVIKNCILLGMTDVVKRWRAGVSEVIVQTGQGCVAVAVERKKGLRERRSSPSTPLQALGVRHLLAIMQIQYSCSISLLSVKIMSISQCASNDKKAKSKHDIIYCLIMIKYSDCSKITRPNEQDIMYSYI